MQVRLNPRRYKDCKGRMTTVKGVVIFVLGVSLNEGSAVPPPFTKKYLLLPGFMVVFMVRKAKPALDYGQFCTV
jgi:hypothetical protein